QLPLLHMSSIFVFAKDDLYFVYPNNYNQFVNYFNGTFQHGGISLEEMIIPYATYIPKSYLCTMKIEVKHLEELKEAAQTIIDAFPQERIFLFYGHMGAGKTTLINELCLLLGVTDHTSSPTFSIVNEYEAAKGQIYHFDFYRLKDEMEAL